MNRAIRKVKEGLQEFIDQRDDFLQVINALDTEFAIILSALKAVEDETPSDIFLQFAVPCHNLDDYLEAVLIRARACMDEANSVREQDEEPALAPLPATCEDKAASVFSRLRAMMEHFRALAGDPLDRHVVFAFLPLEIHDKVAYANLISGLFPRKGHDHWMRGMRVMVRDDAAAPFIAPYLEREGIQDVRFMEADLSFDALAGAIEEETADPNAPMLQRALGLIQLAGIDIAYSRYLDAATKFRASYNYFTQAENVPYRALSLHGMGLAVERGGSLEPAKKLYQQGLAVAAGEPTALPISLLLTSSLGDLCHTLREHDESLEYYVLADQVAGRLMNLTAKIDVMTKQGDVYRDMRQPIEAFKRWIAAGSLCQEFKMFHQWHELLTRQNKLCKQEGLRERLREVEEERALAEEMARRESA